MAGTGTSRAWLEARSRWSPYELVFWLATLLPFLLFPTYLTLASQIAIAALFALSLDLVLGYAGIVTLGHAMFFGIGAYTAGLISKAGWGEPLTGLAASAALAGELERAAQPGGELDRLLAGAEEPGGGRGGDEDEADGEEHLVELAGAVEPAEEGALEGDAYPRRGEEGERQRGEEGQAERPHGEDGDVAAEHGEGAVREVDEAHQPERHRQPHRQDEEQHPEGEAVEEDDGEAAGHAADVSWRRAAGPWRPGSRG